MEKVRQESGRASQHRAKETVEYDVGVKLTCSSVGGVAGQQMVALQLTDLELRREDAGYSRHF